MSVQNFSFLVRLEVAEKFVVVVGKIHSLYGEDPQLIYVVVQTSFRVQLEFKLNKIGQKFQPHM